MLRKISNTLEQWRPLQKLHKARLPGCKYGDLHEHRPLGRCTEMHLLLETAHSKLTVPHPLCKTRASRSRELRRTEVLWVCKQECSEECLLSTSFLLRHKHRHDAHWGPEVPEWLSSRWHLLLDPTLLAYYSMSLLVELQYSEGSGSIGRKSNLFKS